MQELLTIRLYYYVTDNHPDILFALEQENKVSDYLAEKAASIHTLSEALQAEGKPAYIVEEICMEALTRQLGPSMFTYLLSVLEEEFETDYNRLKESGILVYEVVNLIAVCKPVFDIFEFSEETDDNRLLRYAITGEIQVYLNSN